MFTYCSRFDSVPSKETQVRTNKTNPAKFKKLSTPHGFDHILSDDGIAFVYK